MKLLLGGPLAGKHLDESFDEKYYVVQAEESCELSVYKFDPRSGGYRFASQFPTMEALEAWRKKQKSTFRTRDNMARADKNAMQTNKLQRFNYAP